MAAKAKKKATGTAPSSTDRYASQVSAETKLKFGPEDSQLAAALRDAKSTYGSDVAAARGTRRAIEDAAKTSKPKFTQNERVARATVDKTQNELDANLKALPNAGALAGAASRDSEGTRRRLAEMLANAKTESDTREREAVSGEAYAVSAARGRLSDTTGKIADRLKEQSQEKGAFAQARSGELVEDARGRSVTRRGQDKAATTAKENRQSADDRAQAQLEETKRHNQATEVNDAKKNGGKRQTPEKTEKAKTAIARALEQANRVKTEGGGRARSEAADLLVNGRGEQTIKNAPRDGKIGGVDYKAGDQLANPVKIPGVKATEQLYASIALDLAYDGHLSTANMRKLQAMGYSVKDLGLKTAGRSGTKAAQDATDKAAANPVKPKPLPSGVGALIPGLRAPATPSARATAASAKPKPAAKPAPLRKSRLFAHPKRPRSAAAGGRQQERTR